MKKEDQANHLALLIGKKIKLEERNLIVEFNDASWSEFCGSTSSSKIKCKYIDRISPNMSTDSPRGTVVINGDNWTDFNVEEIIKATEEQIIVNFLIELIEKQKESVEQSDESSAGDIAYGLFANEHFYNWMIKKYGAEYTRETKVELRGQNKSGILFDLKNWIRDLKETSL